MLKSETNFLRNTKKQKWHPSIAFWAPHPENTLYISKHMVQDTKRNAFHYRKNMQQNKIGQIKTQLLGTELDILAQEHQDRTQEIFQNLNTLEKLTDQLGLTVENKDKQTENNTSPNLETTSVPLSQTKTYEITIVPGDPVFIVEEELRTTLISGLYNHPTQWLPSYGQWFSHMTESAMQRRLFPKELKGNINFQNSTSLKLMKAVLSTVSRTNDDVFDDRRHLSDTNAALCLLNGYYCIQTSFPIPKTYLDLLADFEIKLGLLVSHLKQTSSSKDFSFTYSSTKQRETIAPLNKSTTYSPDFFSNHLIYDLFKNANMFFSTKTKLAPDQLDTVDIVYAITNNIFGEDIPPFMTFQWNLRVGIKGLEIFIILYILLETAQISNNTISRRLHLQTLLGNQYQTNISINSSGNIFFKKGQIISFLARNYMIPTLLNVPQASTSFLFPGIVLISLESYDMGHMDPSKKFINLTGIKYNNLFEIINQRYLILNPQSLLQAQTSLRLNVEDGLNVLLTKISPVTSAIEIIKTQFGGGDDYDRIYFVILGCLPVSVAVV